MNAWEKMEFALLRPIHHTLLEVSKSCKQIIPFLNL